MYLLSFLCVHSSFLVTGGSRNFTKPFGDLFGKQRALPKPTDFSVITKMLGKTKILLSFQSQCSQDRYKTSPPCPLLSALPLGVGATKSRYQGHVIISSDKFEPARFQFHRRRNLWSSSEELGHWAPDFIRLL